jgi:hypothetical protein
MARIRTLKPELPADRKLASVSRDARLTFILAITQADDDGLLRAGPREVLASLYPNDPDVTSELLDGWIGQLVAGGFLRERQTVDGARVLEICNWRKHQKIDRPSPSRIGPLVKVSRAPREEVASPSLLDLGPRTVDLGPGSKALVELRSTQPPDTSGVDLRTQERHAREAGLRLGIEVVFAYWHARLGKNGKTVLDPKRERRILARLRENGGDVSELLYAIDGALRDDWIMGRDPKAPRAYDGIETIFRDRGQVERLATTVPSRRERHPFLEEQHVPAAEPQHVTA